MRPGLRGIMLHDMQRFSICVNPLDALLLPSDQMAYSGNNIYSNSGRQRVNSTRQTEKRYAAQTIRYKTIANWKRKGIFGMHASRVAVSDRRTDGHWCRPARIHTRLMATEQCVPCSPSFACLSHRTISQDKYNINDALVECWISTVDSNRFDTKQDCDGQSDGQTDTIRHTIPRCIQSHGETVKAHFCYKIQTAKTFLHRCLGN